MESLEETVKIAVSSAFGECKKEIAGVASPKTRKGSGKGATNVDVGDIMTRVIAALQPLLNSVICAAVKASNEALLHELRMNSCPQSTASTVQTNSFEIDRLEQYCRKDNIEVIGFPEEEDENCVDIVKSLGEDIGVTIEDADISTAHRVKSKGRHGNPIIVRFVRRDTTDQNDDQQEKAERSKEGCVHPGRLHSAQKQDPLDSQES